MPFMDENWHIKAKKLLRKKHITMDTVGNAWGLKKAAVSLKLNGKAECTIKEVMIIAGMLGLSIDELCADDPNYKKDDKYAEFNRIYRQLDESQKKLLVQMMQGAHSDFTED